jgi:hypothetical protein
MQNKKLNEALKYYEKGWSIIPTGNEKKALVKWAKYQKERADEKQLKAWWKRWPDANPAAVTGEISGLIAVDNDSQDGYDAVMEYIPETLEYPISKTPRGFHNFFKYRPGLRSGPSIIKDTDIKTDGGYIILPPSTNGKGKYQWLPDLNPTKVNPSPMPDCLFNFLTEVPASEYASAPMREHIKKDASLFKNESTSKRAKQSETFLENETSETIRNKRNIEIGFEEGFRDNTLYHIFTCLHRGGMAPANINKIAHFLGANCSPPFPVKEIDAKIKSVYSRANSVEKGLTEQLREFIESSWGEFSETNAQQSVTIRNNRNIRAKIRSILSRIARTEGTIERVRGKSGWYRKVESDCQPVDWQNASTETVKLWLPFGLDEMAMIPPGSIISIAGEPNSGKTAACMNIARYNFDDWNVHYFSSEMGPGAFKRRVALFPDTLPENFKVNFYPRGENFADVIKPGAGNLNIIDYLELHKDFYLVSGHLKDIYAKLDGAVAVVALQKSPGQEVGRGGSFSIEKPVLSLSLSPGVATIAKLKEWSGEFNPNKMQYHFKLVDGCRFIRTQSWHRPME